MSRFMRGILFFMFTLTACHSASTTEDKDEFPEFSQEQLDQMLRNQAMANSTPQQVTLPQLIAQMEASLAQQPSDTTLLYDLAGMHYQQYTQDSSTQSAQRSVAYYTEVINLDPDFREGRAYYNRMLSRLVLGDYEAALTDIDRFVVINAGQTPVNYPAMQAELLYLKGDEAAACAKFLEALTLAERDSLPAGDTERWKQRCGN